MIDLGLSAADMRAYIAALLAPMPQTGIRAEIWDKSRQLSAIIPYLIDGQVNIDVTSAAGRTATVTVADPDNHLRLDENLLYLNRILHLAYGVWVDQLAGWVWCPIFTGPVNKADVSGAEVAIEAQGMELWALGNIVNPRTFTAGSKITDAIRTLMTAVVGEDPFWLDIPDLPDTLASDYETIGPPGAGGNLTTPWEHVTFLAQLVGHNVFYDGAGRCCLRVSPAPQVFEFADGPAGAVVGQPTLTTLIGGTSGTTGDLTQVKNYVVVHGAFNPDGSQIIGTAVVPPPDPLSPQSLGFPGGEGMWLKDIYANSQIHLQVTADSAAAWHLTRDQLLSKAVGFTSAVIPFLDPWDGCALTVPDFTTTFHLTQASIPLNPQPDQMMTVGYNRLVSIPPRPRRR